MKVSAVINDRRPPECVKKYICDPSQSNIMQVKLSSNVRSHLFQVLVHKTSGDLFLLPLGQHLVQLHFSLSRLVFDVELIGKRRRD